MQPPRITVLPTPEEVARAAAEIVIDRCRAVLDERPTFTLCLAGGSTPRRMYELLARPPHSDNIDWERVEMFFGDERCVPPDHADSNYRMAREALLEHMPIPPGSVHRMKGELDPEEAAREYGRLLKERFGDDGVDLLLLGMGDDGHTLSLFPETSALDEREHRCVANFVPKLADGKGEWRITLTPVFANRSREGLALVTGAGKAAAVEAALQGHPDPRRYPIQLIDLPEGRLQFLLDAAAAGME